jgi:hypothetical protein
MAALYCDCRYEIWSDLWWTEQGPLLIFMDNRASSASYGKEAVDCPGCGRVLKLGALKSENYRARI